MALTKQVEGALAAQVAALAKAPPTDAEMTRARNIVLAEFVPRLETVTGLANQSGLSWMLTGDAGMFLRDLASLEAVKPADVQRACATHLGSDARVTLVMPPGAAP
jgi:zinc protease